MWFTRCWDAVAFSTLGNFYVGMYLKYQNLKLIFVSINMIYYAGIIWHYLRKINLQIPNQHVALGNFYVQGVPYVFGRFCEAV